MRRFACTREDSTRDRFLEAALALDEALIRGHRFEAELHLLHVVMLYGDSPAHDGADLAAPYERLSLESPNALLTGLDSAREEFYPLPESCSEVCNRQLEQELLFG